MEEPSSKDGKNNTDDPCSEFISGVSHESRKVARPINHC